MNAKDRFQNTVRLVGEFFEDQWFDRTHSISTSGDVLLSAAGIAPEAAGDSEYYMPARPRHIRRALRAMPVRDVSDFTYIDLGCGKGRSLFVAAELPFSKVVGVELSAILYRQSCMNIRSFQSAVKRGCKGIETVHRNAQDFIFPEGNLVLYLFNPFGAATMGRVLENLDSARNKHPRHVVVILLWPKCGDQVAALKGMRLHCETKQYQIFEARAEAVAG